MSTITLVITALGVLITIFFAAAYVRGVRNAVNSFRQPPGPEKPVPQDGHWISMAFAVLVSIVSIVGVGYSAAFVYVGPFLVLVSAAGTALAFFLEEKVPVPPK
jgi:hypothetical protein